MRLTVIYLGLAARCSMIFWSETFIKISLKVPPQSLVVQSRSMDCASSHKYKQHQTTITTTYNKHQQTSWSVITCNNTSIHQPITPTPLPIRRGRTNNRNPEARWPENCEHDFTGAEVRSVDDPQNAILLTKKEPWNGWLMLLNVGWCWLMSGNVGYLFCQLWLFSIILEQTSYGYRTINNLQTNAAKPGQDAASTCPLERQNSFT